MSNDDPSPARPGMEYAKIAPAGEWRNLPVDMRPASEADWGDWRWHLAHGIDDAARLAKLVGLDEGRIERLHAVERCYPAKVTPYYLTVARRWAPDDPIVRQFLPSERELEATGLSPDGLGEGACSPLPGLVQRYPNRALIVVSHACAVLCRHCFRKRLWRAGENQPVDFTAILDYVASRASIREVILSGGDALLCAEDRLFDLLANLTTIKHVSAVRLASRLPVVLPQRITPALCRRLATHAPLWFMTQFNHPLEVTPAAATACRNLLSQGIPVMNQTVLLKGVNDDRELLAELFERLVGIGVKPYYLFHGDPVAGTAHFRTGVACGLRIMDDLRHRLSGLATPTFAIDLPAGGGKVVLEPDRQLVSKTHGRRVYRAFDGREIEYH